MVTRTFANASMLLGLLFLAGTGCAGDDGLAMLGDGGPGTEPNTNVGTETQTSTLTVTQTKTTASTDTATSTVTRSATSTLTSTATSTASLTATGTPSATSTQTSTSSSTATTTGTATMSGTETHSAVTVVTTETVTTTMTKLSTYGDYTLYQRSLPPNWTCPAGATATGGASGGTGSQVPTASTLSVSDCKSLADLRRPILRAQSQSQLDQTRAGLIAYNCSPRSETVCLDKAGNIASLYNCGSYGVMDAGVGWAGYGGSMSVPGTGGAAGSGATDYSTTNTQVASVDEADYVKNDGNTIFVLGNDGVLHVLDAWPAAETREIAKITLAGTPRRMFLLDNRLVVYSRDTSGAGGTTGGAGASNPSDQGCTYGYDCRFSSEGGHTLIQVFDVTTPATPTELVRYEMSGGYVDSRRIGSFVYTVVHDTGATQVPGLSYTLSATGYDDLQAKYAQLLAANLAKIDGSTDDFFLPWATMTKPGGAAVANSGCAYALATQYAQGGSFVSISTFDLTKPEQPTRTIMASNAGYIYASATALYMAVDRNAEQTYGSSYYTSSHQASDSFVHKFKLNGLETAYVGSVTLPGHILNQFAMDENNGVLRVASTKGWVPDAMVTSYVTTYGDQTGALTQLGQIGNIGTGEDIRSVRFDGDRGFLVTFKKTDPLFVFDLKNASAPKLLGELQIPGFSTYMQPLDANHMLAIGFTADDQGSYAYFNGIQIQIFDVTDLANPTLQWKTVIGTRGSNSEALTNHLAFNYFAPKKMLALPMTICEGGGNGSFGTNMTFAGLMAFDISLDTGIKEHGRLSFVDPSTVATGTDCGSWWTSSKSLVKRSIFMDDYIYGMSDAQLRVAALSSMSTVLRSVVIGK